jgi:alkanesulfonate monooxygenase SsuD/methylene tetrahydromethanopterin reductase-like flavin-dependent oxidoreductase (luciferase family)
MGHPPAAEFAAFGEDPDLHARATRLDEGLRIIDGLWRGEALDFRGRAYRLDGVVLQPRPVQLPRIPLWIATTWPHTSGLARAARYDGVVPLKADAQGMPVAFTPEELVDLAAGIAARRDVAAAPEGRAYDVMVYGETGTDAAAEAEQIRSLEAAGATWWAEYINGFRGPPDALLARIRAGAPRASDAPRL